MKVLVDETGQDDEVPQCLVEPIGHVPERRHHGLEGPHRQDPIATHRDRLRGRVPRLHRVEASGNQDAYLAHARMVLPR
jgi:hypothetical protein